MHDSPLLIIRDHSRSRWLRFVQPVEVLTANDTSEVIPLLRRIGKAVDDGFHAAGFLSYEAAPAFDTSYAVHADDSGFPLLWFGLFREPEPLDTLPLPAENEPPETLWQPEITREEYYRSLTRIREYIGEGDTYQVNFTYRLRAQFAACPMDTFLRMAHTQRPAYAAYIDTGEWTVISASPELFFHREGGIIESKPMKGTSPRGLWYDHDSAIGKELAASPKNRAENVMIADMVRNDLGRIAPFGGVTTPRLFEVERHPTVWQMTSTVRAETSAPADEVFEALFPPASITGAPRSRTMEIIAGLETSPRRIYTGAIGFLSPADKGRICLPRSQFSVAIRTILIDLHTGIAEYGAGGGIVWDSEIEAEWQESITKTHILRPSPGFDLLETIRWEPDSGYRLLRLHLNRLAQSAEYFGFGCKLGVAHRELRLLAKGLPPLPHRVRLLMSPSGAISMEAAPLDMEWTPPSRVKLVRGFVHPDDRFLYHKTTNRRVYDDARAVWPQYAEVLLANDRGEITEAAIANVAVELDGYLQTPPLSCGLLPGTWREWLIGNGRLRERVITVDDIKRVQAVWLFNSVRGMWRVQVDE